MNLNELWKTIPTGIQIRLFNKSGELIQDDSGYKGIDQDYWNYEVISVKPIIGNYNLALKIIIEK